MYGRHLAYLALLVLAIIAPLVISDSYFRHILVLCLIWSIVVSGFNLIEGYANIWSFGHAAFFGIGAYATAILALELGLPVLVSMLAAIILTGVIGFLVGFASLRRRIKAMYFFMFTFGFGIITWLFINSWVEVTRGRMGLYGIPPITIGIPNLFEIQFVSELSFYYLALVVLLFTLYFISSLLSSRFGRAVIAQGKNEALARSVGVNIFRHTVLIFTISTMTAGLGGALYSEYMRIISPGIASMHYMFLMIIMIIVGGVSTKGGPLVGAFVFVILDELLRPLGEVRIVILGLLLLLFILFMPKGLYPGLTLLSSRLSFQMARLRSKLARRPSE